ncbi:hypothetical protein CQA4T8M7_18460 [Sphaerotilus natans]|nr:hypothetical protein CQA4T8M7_18460 [Sphaerotilus natans]
MPATFVTSLARTPMTAGLNAVALAAVLALAGCGGGGGEDSPPASGSLTLSGIVAARTAESARSIDVKCASGSGTATSNSDGSYTVTVTGGSLPCVLRAAGTTDGDLYSVAYGSGRTATANLTPLTQLVVASMAAGDPATFYGNFSADTAALVTAARVDAAVSTVQADLTARGIDATGVDNPVTAALVPAGTTQTGNTYGQVLAGLEANLTTAGMTLAQLTTAVASASPPVRLPAALLSQPQASNCAALRSGPVRVVWLAPAGLKADGDFDTISRGTMDATTLTFTADNGTVTHLSANGTCRYAGSTGLNGDPADAVVSQAGVMVMTSKINGVNRLGVALPEQSLTLADLAGEFNMMNLEGSPSAGHTVTAKLGSAGDIVWARCFNEDVLARTCTTQWPPFAPVAADGRGGFTMRSIDPADPWTDRWFAYRTGSGDLMVLWIGSGGSWGVFTPNVARTLPTVGGSSRSWDMSMDMDRIASSTVFSESAFVTKSTDAATDSYVRTRRNPLLVTDDSHDEKIQQNWPRNGYAHRPAGSSTTPTGTTINFREWVSLRLLGTGLSVTYSVPTATQAGVMSFGVTQ